MREGDLPLGIWLGQPAAVVGMLEQSVHQGAVRRFQRIRALNLDQLGSLWKAVVVGLLLDRETSHATRLSLASLLGN